MNRKPNVVIACGGFGGLAAAKALAGAPDSVPDAEPEPAPVLAKAAH